MQYPVTRYSNSLLLQKFHRIAAEHAQTNWRLEFVTPNGPLFDITTAKDVVDPWKGNLAAEKLSQSAGASGTTITFTIDGRPAAIVTRADNEHNDRLTIEQGWFGSNGDEANRIRYIVVSGIITSEFGVINSGTVPIGLSGDLARFVETRDQSLARLEELYARFAEKLITDRANLAHEITEKTNQLEIQYKAKEAALSAEMSRQAETLASRENELKEQLKTIDDRGAKHARRALRESIIAELSKRDTTFNLTKGTQRLRWPVASILIVSGILFTIGLAQNALMAVDIIKAATDVSSGQVAASLSATGWNWVIAYFLLKQVAFTAGLLSVIWYGIRWSDRWFREHAKEEFKSKTMQLDILRANWVVETAFEWKHERDQQIPPELLDRLTHNLFRYPEENTNTSDASSLAAILLGSAANVRLNVGNGNEIELTKSGAGKLSKSLSSSD